ncbi:MAG: hypothetical protein ACOX2X_09975 [Peptococcia bacterium]
MTGIKWCGSRAIPRYIAEKAERYLRTTGIADRTSFGPEFEFYLIDHVSYAIERNNISVQLDSETAEWHTKDNDYPNLGFKVPYQQGYHVDIPYDVNFELRKKMVLQLEEMGVPIKYHHPEVGSSGQMEVEICFGNLFEMADRTMLIKYVDQKYGAGARQDGHFYAEALLPGGGQRHACTYQYV